MRQGLVQLVSPERAAYYTRVAGEISQSATGYALANLLTSLIAGVVIFDWLPLIPGAIAYIRLRLRPGADGKTKPATAQPSAPIT
jgi:hypothetical protein